MDEQTLNFTFGIKERNCQFVRDVGRNWLSRIWSGVKMDKSFTNYLVLKLIQRNRYETVYQLRKDFKKIMNHLPTISSFYRQIRKLENNGYIMINAGIEISLTNKGEKKLRELEKLITFALTMVSCGTDS